MTKPCTQPFIQIQNVSKYFGKFCALDSVSLDIALGQKLVICGPSGSGKSTLIRCINRLEIHERGEIYIDGKIVNGSPAGQDVLRNNVGMVFQQFNLFPHLTILENLMLGPVRARHLPESEARDLAMQYLERVRIPEQLDKYPAQLSGGQQQRVALARSLVKEANIVLLDEPLVNLDYKLREQLREEFRNIFSAKASENSILIYSSTDPVEAMQLGGQILVMDEGRILQQDSAKEVFENPNSTKVSQITNDPAMNLFEGTVADGKIILSSEIQFDLPQHCQALPQGPYTFGLRAAAISLAEGGFPFTVELSEISGSETFLHLKHEHVQVVGLLDSVQNFNIGETVTAQFDTAHLYAFATDGRLKSSPYGGLK